MTKNKHLKNYMQTLRNIGVIAHIDAGKTTLTERILFYSHRIHRMGEVHEGLATMDYMPEEQERGITITSACTTIQWRDGQFNIIDTPGHVDFTIEVERSLRVLDGAIGVFDAVAGVEPQSETVWRQSERYRVPKLAFINKLDRVGADFQGALDQMRDKLHARPLPLTVPVGEGPDFAGVIDILTMCKLVFDQGTQGAHVEALELSEEERRYATGWREKLLDVLCENDDELLGSYLAGEDLPEARLRSSIRRATLSLGVIPVFAGSALRNIGVQPVMDAILDYLPSPLDLPEAIGLDPTTKVKRAFPASPDAPLAALVFKVIMDGGRKLALFRLYSGRLAEAQEVFNATRNTTERVGKLYRLHAGRRDQIEEASAGDIVAVGGMRHARTGDTICSREAPVVLEAIGEYKPVISLALEAKSGEQTERLTEALERYLQEDPTLFLEHEKDTGQIILSGMGELHLEVLLQRLKREWNVEPRAGRPQVLYQETVVAGAEGAGEFDRLLGGEPHYGFVRVSVEPLARGAGCEVVLAVDPDYFRAEILQAAEDGADDALNVGVQGYHVQDARVRIEELRLKDGLSTALGFRMAAACAVKEALSKASPALLEPIMHLEISVPDDFVGDVVGLLGSKGAKIENLFDRSGQKVVQALAAMRRLFGFSTELRSATQGRAGLTMRFDRFDVLQ